MNDRFVRPLNVALVTALSAALAAPTGAQTPVPGYAPLTARYRIVRNTQVSQVMQGQSQDSETTANSLTTVVIAKDGGGLSLTITLDSISATGTGAAPVPDPSSAMGLRFVGAMSADGRVATSSVLDKAGGTSDSPFAPTLRSFLPRLTVGATPGTTWSDTSNTSRAQNGGMVATTIITTYTLVGDTTVAGAKGWKLASTTVGTVSGTGNQGGADYTIKGTISGAGAVVVGTSAALVGSDMTSDARMLVDVPMAGIQIPITQKETTKIRRVP